MTYSRSSLPKTPLSQSKGKEVSIKAEKDSLITSHGYYDSPVGNIRISASEKYIIELYFLSSIPNSPAKENKLTREAVKQLDEYFQGKRKSFDLPLLLTGTEFQKKVWNQLRQIPYATVCSYKDIAEDIGHPRACRAVGNANNKNKISVLIPCHRVIASNGSLSGYGGQEWRKEWLLRHEKTFDR